MSTISTHVLDTAVGAPAAGIRVTLTHDGREIASAVTDVDGRVRDLQGRTPLAQGTYSLAFAVGPYFAAAKRETFFETIAVEFKVGTAPHYHVPLLLSPFGYATYRGS